MQSFESGRKLVLAHTHNEQGLFLLFLPFPLRRVFKLRVYQKKHKVKDSSRHHAIPF